MFSLISLLGGIAPPCLARPLSGLAQAQTQTQPTTGRLTPQQVLELLFTSPIIPANWFATSFLAQVSAPQLQDIIADLKKQLGPYQGVQAQGDRYIILFAKGLVPTQLVMSQKGLIAGLIFQAPQARLQTPMDLTASFKALPGKVSLLVLEDGAPQIALNATEPLGVGSAFKLAVLAALKSEVVAQKQTWETILTLKSEWSSLPSGVLQSWPAGSVLTLSSLAALMISQSDNTATDHLIYLLGKPALEAISPRNQPFLTTREAFILKNPDNQDLRARYLAADLETRRRLLTEVAPLPEVSVLEGGLISPEIEWFFTTEELCSLIAQVADLPAMRINPGVANLQDWNQVAFKGGSEPGVLNLTSWLVAKNGKQYCVSATWNQNQPLAEAEFLALYNGLLKQLSRTTSSVPPP
ncbi:MAG: serine hydrolase [Acaryochloridaceae cyanobacterium SU_2_1]|nr:serine hydrolase [Acaryochloridaceae cyanobacterium SU_2_1]